MATLSSVEHAMVRIAAAALFPGVAYVEGALVASPAVGCAVKVFRGWPVAADLDATVLAGNAQVSVHVEPGMTQRVSRYSPEFKQGVTPPATIAGTVSGHVVTLTGAAAAGQVVGVQIGRGTLLHGFAYRVLATDTLATVAFGLAQVIPGATSAGAQVTLPGGAFDPAFLVGVDTAATAEVRRQTQGFRVCCWCPNPLLRDAIADAVDLGFAGLLDAFGSPTQFIATAEGSPVRILYRTTYSFDAPAKDRTWRRDLYYSVEYPTTLTVMQPMVLFQVLAAHLNGADPAVQIGTAFH